MDNASSGPVKAQFGVSGLDEVLCGGLTRNRIYLLEGHPGSGKTTLGLQFLSRGANRGERGLYITLSETKEELLEVAASHDWSIPEHIEIVELAPPETLLDETQKQSLLYSSDLELSETTRRLFEMIDRSKPSRVVIDSLSELRLLAQSSLRYRREILAIKHYFTQRQATVLLLDDLSADVADKTVHSVAHGVIRLEELTPEYGAERRRLRVLKYRGQPFRGGYHDFTIKTGGVEVFPRLVAAEHRIRKAERTLGTGIDQLDQLVGGGIDSGSSTLVVGPAGTGKSLLVFQFIAAAVRRGEHTALFAFDEELGLLFSRSKALGIDLERMRDDGNLVVVQVDAAEISPGEFAHIVRAAVENGNIQTVAIDSLNGYQNAMPDERHLMLHMHELLLYLNRVGAQTFLTVAQHGMVSDMKTPVDVSYLADTVILLRYFEAFGEVRRAISVLKKRTGSHERTIREYEITSKGITVGPVLHDFQGVLRGVPEYVGRRRPVTEEKGA